MRRFELRDGASSKFWEVEVRRNNVMVRFGRNGTNGQTRSKPAASASDARAELERLVREKLAKGYREQGKPDELAAPGAATPSTRKPTLKELAAQPRAKKSVDARSSAEAVADAWSRIESVLATKHPTLDLKLRPPAKPSAIASAEKTLGATFPDDYRASLLVHDGQDDEVDVLWLPHALRFGSLASVVACWKSDRGLYDAEEMAKRLAWLDRTRRVRQVHLHPQQIPIAGSEFWDYGRLLLDFVPGPDGAEGQVIARDDCDFVFVAETFGDLLEKLARGLETGKTRPSRVG